MMYELTIITETAKAGHERVEYFTTPEAGIRRRRFLKSIEAFGSSNTYRLLSATEQIAPRLRHRRTY